MTPVAAASLALRGSDDPGSVVWEPIDGPRFPNGAVALDGVAQWCAGPTPAGLIQARRWWDPAVPSVALAPELVARFVAGLDPIALPGEPANCIGWGPGLTPAGDDVVVGMLIGFRCAGRVDLAESLTAQCLDAETAPFSRTLLDYAGRGDAAGPVRDLVRALAGVGSLSDAVTGLERFGATSGRHILDGLRRALTEAGAMTPSEGVGV